MRALFQLTVVAASLLGAVPALAQQTVLIGVPAELSGSGGGDGTHWKNGVDLAVSEINAKGGILGRKIETISQDTQSNPGIARAVVQKMLDQAPYAIVGPVLSSECRVVMIVTEQAETPLFCGGENADLTSKGNQYYFRTSLAQQFSLPVLANYIRDVAKAKTIVILWENDVAGKGSRDVMYKEATERGIKVLADMPSENNQIDFSADVVKARSYNPDAIYIHLREPDTARFLKEYRRQGVTIPLIGDTTLLSQHVIDLAGDAAEGVKGYVGLSADAPMPGFSQFRKKYERYGSIPDHNAIKGYIAIYAIKYTTEKMGKFDKKELARIMHDQTILAKDEPGMLLDTTWDKNGDIDRESFMVEIAGGKHKVIEILPRRVKVGAP